MPRDHPRCEMPTRSWRARASGRKQMTINLPIPGRAGRPWILLAAATGMLRGMVIGPALATDPTATPPFTCCYPPEHTISVQGTGTLFLKPDLAEVNLGVDVTRSNLTDA